jgi:hypothetical protein
VLRVVRWVVVSCLALLFIIAPQLTALPTSGASPSAIVEAKYFSQGFSPDQVAAAAGAIWQMSSGPTGVDYGTGCRMGRLDPITMALTIYPIPLCGMNVTAGNGALFLETTTADAKTESYAIRIERFSTSTHLATILSALSTTLFLGSDIAHTQLGYYDGSLWLYATPKASSSPQLLQLSPATGAVEWTYVDVPKIGGTEPIILAAAGYLWLAGGAGAGADFMRINVRTHAQRLIRPAGNYVSVYNMVSVNKQIYFAYLEPSSGTTSAGSLTSHVAHLSPSGAVVARSPNEQVGSWLVGLGGKLFSVGPSGSCTSGLRLWSINEETLRTTPVADLKTPGNACIGGSIYRQVAAVNDAVFDLYDGGSWAVLYRVTRL